MGIEIVMITLRQGTTLDPGLGTLHCEVPTLCQQTQYKLAFAKREQATVEHMRMEVFDTTTFVTKREPQYQYANPVPTSQECIIKKYTTFHSYILETNP